MELTPRLQTVYDMLSRGETFIDVGTDHAHLPIKLVESGKFKTATASDIADGPLAAAKENIAAAGLEEKIDSVLSDGFQRIAPTGPFSAAICGMGGEMIASVLSSSPDVAHAAKELILQPMTKEERLRKFLWDNGYEITLERAAAEGEKTYIAMAVRFTGRAISYSEAELYLGKEAALDPSPDMAARLETLATRYEKIARSSGDEGFSTLARAAGTLAEIVRRKTDERL